MSYLRRKAVATREALEDCRVRTGQLKERRQAGVFAIFSLDYAYLLHKSTYELPVLCSVDVLS